MPRKTDSHNPADWLWIAASDMELVRVGAEKEISFAAARSKLAEILEKILKAELLRLGYDPDWPKLRAQVEGVTTLLETVKSRLPASG